MQTDNTNKPTSHTKQIGDFTPPITNGAAPLIVEDAIPPMMGSGTLYQTNTSLTEDTKTDKINVGSTAPNNDILSSTVITTNANKNRFVGGKVIATILGLFLLVGGIGAGLILTQQNQNLEEKAAQAFTCTCKNPNGTNAGNGICNGSECTCTYPTSVKSNNCNGGGIGPGETQDEQCEALLRQCDTNGDGSVEDEGNCLKEWTSDCSDWKKDPGPKPTAPTITASCQNLKAYSSNWTPLTGTQLTLLKVNETVNFCVTGVASGGSFDKAKITVNGMDLPETTLKRPNSEDFCSPYTIQAGAVEYMVLATIHHSTLGWK